MYSCDSCGKPWPEKYCPECARTIREKSDSAPPPLPASPSPIPPPLPTAPASRRKTALLWALGVLGGLALLLVGGGLFYHEYQGYVFPPGYRNRPTTGWKTRPGEKEFDQANDGIDAFQGTNGFGNSPAAVELARRFSETLKEARGQLFTPEFKLEILDHTKGEFITYCELHREECAFIVHVPHLRNFDKDPFQKVDARRLLAQLAWRSAQEVLKRDRAGKPKMELAVGLRGISQYGPILLGYYDESPSAPESGVIKYVDDADKTHFLWTFFAPEGAETSR